MTAINLTCNETTYTIPTGTSLEQALSLIEPMFPLPVVAVVDNIPRELSYVPTKDCQVRFLDYTDNFGSLVYKRSVIFMLSLCCQRLYPQHTLWVLHSLDKGVYCELRGGTPLQQTDFDAISQAMAEMVRQALPITSQLYTKWEAIDLFRSLGMEQKAQLLRQASITYVPIYQLEGQHQFLFGAMATNTCQLSSFRLEAFDQGFVLALPSRRDAGFQPNKPQEPKRLQAILKSYDDWGRLLETETVLDLNRSVENGFYDDLVLIAESMQQRTLHAICDEVFAHFPGVRLLMVAGPSSSGKTTFTRRLDIELRALGLKPLSISMDNYFIDKAATPLDEYGRPDFENINTVDLPLFNQQLSDLIAGKQVALPVFDFVSGTRSSVTIPCHMGPENILLIEGIHALNPILTQAIPQEQKRSIYISCLTQLNLDPLVPISSSDNRLLRRMIRDVRSRNTSPEETLEHWPAVRRGEGKNIFPFQEQADFYFNSSLIYELPALRPLIDAKLQTIGPDSPVYGEAQRLLEFLQYFTPAQPRCIPAHSILQEFLGNGCFDI